MPGHDLQDFWLLLWQVQGLVADGADLDRLVGEVTVPTQGGVTARQRLDEAQAIVEEWSTDLLLVAQRSGAGWHALYEPARWRRAGSITPETMCDKVWPFAADMVARKGRWPRPDELRRLVGMTSGHRLPGENEDQEALL